MIKFIYSDKGNPVNDFCAEQFINDLIASNKENVMTEVLVCNEVVLTAMTLALMEEKIPMEQIELYYFDKPMRFDSRYGLEIPDGVGDIGVNLPMTHKILQCGMDNIRKKARVIKPNIQGGEVSV